MHELFLVRGKFSEHLFILDFVFSAACLRSGFLSHLNNFYLWREIYLRVLISLYINLFHEVVRKNLTPSRISQDDRKYNTLTSK